MPELRNFTFGVISILFCNSISETMGTKSVAVWEDVKNLKNNTILIDVREPNELEETGVIPGSINIPLGTFEDALKKLSAEEFSTKYHKGKPTFDTPIIVFCQIGKRSGTAQDIALKLGYTNVKNYEGSWIDWESHL